MTKQVPTTAVLHYSAPPTVGGVESVINAHARTFLQEGYPIHVIAGSGKADALPQGCEFWRLALLDSQNQEILHINRELEKGTVPDVYYQVRERIMTALEQKLCGFDNVIVHNIFTKHFNLPLTDALHRLLDEGKIHHCIAWCHDFSWSSPHSRVLLHDGKPWDLLRQYRKDISYVTVSEQRQQTLADLFGVPKQTIQVIYNGIDPQELLGSSAEGECLARKLGLDSADLIMLMPVRITRAKNIEFALQVTARLCAAGCNVRVLLSGPPDPHDSENMAYFKELKALRASLGVTENFRFLYDENPHSSKAYILDMEMIGELYRMCDLVFMPSHREGFGMPVLEAGFSGKPVFATAIPAAQEIRGEFIHAIDIESAAERTAEQILDWATRDATHQLRAITRQQYTWQTIFRNNIQPLLAFRDEQ